MGSSRLERTCYWATRPGVTTKQQRHAPCDSKSFPVSHSTLLPSEQPATCRMQKLLVLDVIFASRLRALSAIAGCCFSRAANIGVSLEGIARISGILPTRLVLREMRPVLDYVRREGRVDEYWNNTAMEPKSKGFYSPTEAAIPRGDSPEGWLPRWDCKIPNFEAPCLYCHYHLLPRPRSGHP